jgi:hypothetical protein
VLAGEAVTELRASLQEVLDILEGKPARRIDGMAD